jgi:hypothetical protein
MEGRDDFLLEKKFQGWDGTLWGKKKKNSVGRSLWRKINRKRTNMTMEPP